jgi:putative hydrolase of the HAD superfamily
MVKKMNQDIQAIFIDVGDTMRILVKDEPYQAQAQRQLAALAGTTESPEKFYARLNERYDEYRKWAFETMIEASEKELWTRWMLPDLPSEKIAPVARELATQFRQSKGRRVVPPDVKPTIVELYKRGYVLGIISNLITEQEIPDWLDADGLTPYFKSVLLSSVFGRRKPAPEIYQEAVRRAGVQAAQSAYVGDNPKRDVVGTRQAGFGMVIILTEPEKLAKEPPTGETVPDVIIHKFSELLDIFPAG